MSSTPKRFTRYEAEFHAPETQYVLAEDHDATMRELQAIQYGSGRLQDLRDERDRLQRLADTLTCELATAQAELTLEQMRHNATRAALEAERQNATRYPSTNPANPHLTVEHRGIRYELEAFEDEDGDWFEVKSATPTEAQTLADFAHSARPELSLDLHIATREVLRQWREDHQRDMEESRGV